MTQTIEDKRIRAIKDIKRRFSMLGSKATSGTIKGSVSINYYCSRLEGNYAQLQICDLNESLDNERLALPRLFNAIALCAAAQ